MDAERRAEFRRIVIKDDTERLRAELKRARPQLTVDEVNQFNREELVEQITDLRLRTGDTRAIKEPIGVPMEGAVGEVLPEVGRPVEIAPHVDPTQALLQMVLLMKREDGDKETRRIEEDRRRVEFERERIEEERKIRREEMLALQLKEEKRLEFEREREEKRMQFEREKEEKKVEEDKRKEELRVKLKEEKKEEQRKLEEVRREEQKRLREEKERHDEIMLKMLENQLRNTEKVEDAAERRHRENLEDSEKSRKEAADRANTREMKLKRGAEILKGCMYKMGDDVLEIPIFFENADRHFESNFIEDDLRLALINPYFSEKARRLVTRLARDETDTYEKVKKALLTEFRLTPQKYRDMFRNASKERSESHVQFATRLQVLWKYYMDSREIKEDYNRLCELMIVDKFKDVLTPNAREFIRNKEEESWNPVQKVARMIDTYVNDLPETRTREESKGAGFNKFHEDKNKLGENRDSGKDWRSNKPFQNKSSEGKERGESKNEVDYRPRCWKCGYLGHLSSTCRRTQDPKNPEKPPVKRVYLMTECEETEGGPNTELTESEENAENGNPIITETVNSLRGADEETEIFLMQIQNEDESNMEINDSVVIALPFTNEMKVNFGFGPVDAVFDTGASITVVREECLPIEMMTRNTGHHEVIVKTATGERTSARIIELPCKIIENETGDEIEPVALKCAVIKNLEGPKCFVSLDAYKKLKTAQVLGKRKLLTGSCLKAKQGKTQAQAEIGKQIETGKAVLGKIKTGEEVEVKRKTQMIKEPHEKSNSKEINNAAGKSEVSKSRGETRDDAKQSFIDRRRTEIQDVGNVPYVREQINWSNAEGAHCFKPGNVKVCQGF